ncbi:MAG: hypothetical protein ACI8O8_002755, partial [Oleiphilaceae bacterium]
NFLLFKRGGIFLLTLLTQNKLSFNREDEI